MLERRTSRTCWKLLMVLPKLRPISGSFFGPKTSAATPAITTSSGTPSPNKQRHPRAPPPCCRRRRGARAALPPPETRNRELEEAREEGFLRTRGVDAIREVEGNAMAAILGSARSLLPYRSPLTPSRRLIFFLVLSLTIGVGYWSNGPAQPISS